MTDAVAPIFDQRKPTPEPYTGPEKRKDWHTPQDCFRLLETQARLDQGSERMKRIEDSITEVKATQTKMVEAHTRFETKLDGNSNATTEILDIISTAKGFFKGTQVIGSVVKWLIGIALAIGAFIAMIKGGGKP